MTDFDDLNPAEAQALLDAMFPPGSNARKIIESTPPEVNAMIDQMMDAYRAKPRSEATDPLAAEADAALDAMTPADWADLEADLQETERQILRERGIDPE